MAEPKLTITDDFIPSNGPVPDPSSKGKEDLYKQIADLIEKKTSAPVPVSFGREIFDKVIEGVMNTAIKTGKFRFNGGYGSMKVKTYKGGTRTLPTQKSTSFGPRDKLRYIPGVEVEKALKPQT